MLCVRLKRQRYSLVLRKWNLAVETKLLAMPQLAGNAIGKVYFCSFIHVMLTTVTVKLLRSL